MQITVVHHPLLQVKMSVLRDLNTNCPTFRRVIGEVAMLLTFEATKKWTSTIRNWGQVYGELSIMYEGRLPE